MQSARQLRFSSRNQITAQKAAINTYIHDAMAEAFHALTPGRQKGYLLHFADAKQSATRMVRVEKNVPKFLKGLGLQE